MSSFRHKVPVYRQGTRYNDSGYQKTGPEVQMEVTVSVQPLSLAEIESLPEGRRQLPSLKLYTNDELISFGMDSRPDQVEIAGERYEVVAKAIWENNVINHNKYLCTKLVEDLQP